MTLTPPTVTDLRARYPAFADVDDAVVAYWINDATRTVTDAWGDDASPGILSLAAHNMVRVGVAGLPQGRVAGLAAIGVTSFRSGAFSVDFNRATQEKIGGGGYDSTIYGQEFLSLARRNVGTFTVTSPGPVVADACGYNGYAGILPEVCR